MKAEIIERFTSYVKIDTQSNEEITNALLPQDSSHSPIN